MNILKVHSFLIVIPILITLNTNIFAQLNQLEVTDGRYSEFSPCVRNLLTQSDQIKELEGPIEELSFLKSRINECGEISEVTRRVALRMLELGDTFYDDIGVELEQDKREIFDEALGWSRLALSQDSTVDKNYEQMSMAFAAIISVSRLKGKAVMADSVRIYAEEAVRINPKNDRAYHILGRWHYEVSKFSWVLRRLSKLVFGHSPEGSFELAINYFNNALELKNIPLHSYWLGMVYLESGNKEEALFHFRKVLELENVQHNDEYFKREAQRLIEKHG